MSCAALEEMAFTGTIFADIAVNGCPKLTEASLLSLLNALAPNDSGKICNIGTRNIIKLTAAQQSIATDKGWTLT